MCRKAPEEEDRQRRSYRRYGYACRDMPVIHKPAHAHASAACGDVDQGKCECGDTVRCAQSLCICGQVEGR